MAARISLSLLLLLSKPAEESAVCVCVCACTHRRLCQSSGKHLIPPCLFPNQFFLKIFLFLSLCALTLEKWKRREDYLNLKSGEHAHNTRGEREGENDDDALHISLKNAVSNNKAIRLFVWGKRPQTSADEAATWRYSGPSRQQQPMPLYAPENNKEKKKKAAVEKCFPPRSILTNRAYIYVLETCVLRSCGRGEKLVRSPRTFDSYLALVAYQHGSSTLSEIDTK